MRGQAGSSNHGRWWVYGSVQGQDLFLQAAVALLGGGWLGCVLGDCSGLRLLGAVWCNSPLGVDGGPASSAAHLY
jgi:hypothetical protein